MELGAYVPSPRTITDIKWPVNIGLSLHSLVIHFKCKCVRFCKPECKSICSHRSCNLFSMIIHFHYYCLPITTFTSKIILVPGCSWWTPLFCTAPLHTFYILPTPSPGVLVLPFNTQGVTGVVELTIET